MSQTNNILLEIKSLTPAQKEAMLLDLCWKLLTRVPRCVDSGIVRECLTIGNLY